MAAQQQFRRLTINQAVNFPRAYSFSRPKGNSKYCLSTPLTPKLVLKSLAHSASRPFSASQASRAVQDSSTIDFAYMPQFELHTPSQSEILRVPILPSNSTAPGRSDEADGAVIRPEITTVSASGTHIDSPSAMSEVTDNHAIDLSPFDLTDSTCIESILPNPVILRIIKDVPKAGSSLYFLRGLQFVLRLVCIFPNGNADSCIMYRGHECCYCGCFKGDRDARREVERAWRDPGSMVWDAGRHPWSEEDREGIITLVGRVQNRLRLRCRKIVNPSSIRSFIVQYLCGCFGPRRDPKVHAISRRCS